MLYFSFSVSLSFLNEKIVANVTFVTLDKTVYSILYNFSSIYLHYT
jgi:hypothetical protein